MKSITSVFLISYLDKIFSNNLRILSDLDVENLFLFQKFTLCINEYCPEYDLKNFLYSFHKANNAWSFSNPIIDFIRDSYHIGYLTIYPLLVRVYHQSF